MPDLNLIFLTLMGLLLLLFFFFLIAIKKSEDYAKTISRIRARTSFALLRSALICLRGTRSTVRKSWDLRNIDIEIENTEGAIY